MFNKQQSILSKHQNERQARLAGGESNALLAAGGHGATLIHDNPSFERVRDQSAPQRIAALPAAPASVAVDTRDNQLHVGPRVRLKGAEIADCDTLVVEGTVEATLDSRMIRIHEGGAFRGKVSIDVAEIHGEFEGELIARERLVIHSTGRVRGSIRYGQVLIERGGVLAGDVQASADSTSERELAGRTPLSAIPS